MRFSRRLPRVLPVASAIALLLASVGCSRQGESSARHDGSTTVRVLISHDPPNLSLIGKVDRNSLLLAAQITDSLLRYDEHMQLQPRLARDWELSEDRRTLTFHLRPGVRWHDGRELTADDVVFTVEQVRDPQVENRSFAPQFRDLVSLEAIDSLTVRATYSVATPDVLDAWRVPIIPRHLAEPGAELLSGRFASHPVGCGPFRFVRYRRGEEIVLEANDDYWDGRPRIDRLVFRIYPDQRTGYQALLAGDIDVMTVTPDLYREALDSEAATRLEGLVYYRLSVWQIGWNLDGSNPYFTDPRVRRAMLLALDRQKFSESLVQGLARPAATSFHPGSPWTDPGILPLPYDPPQARRLLDEAGWLDRDGDGVRERDGRAFRFTLTIHRSTQGINDHMAAWLQQSWSELGMRAEIEKIEWSQFRERRRAHEFEAAMAGLSFSPTPDQFELYHSTEVDSFNFVSLSDPEVDRLLEQGRTTFDPERRRAIYFALQQRLDELQPIGNLLHFPTPVLHDRRLRGIVPAPLDHWRITRGPREWYWAEDPPE